MKTITSKELLKQEEEIKKRCVLFMKWYWEKKYKTSLFSCASKNENGRLSVEDVYDVYLKEYFNEGSFVFVIVNQLFHKKVLEHNLRVIYTILTSY